MKWTTVRVRPARKDVLAQKGIERQNGATLMEVTCYGETVGIVDVAQIENIGKTTISVPDKATLWSADGFTARCFGEVIIGACRTIECAQKAGVMPA